MDEQVVARFEAKINKTDSCWLWTAAKYVDGYGAFRLRDPRRQERAHRVAWQIYHGPIPSGQHVLHRCDVRECVNPEHLWLGTNLDNIRDRQRKGRGLVGDRNHQRQKTHCPQNHPYDEVNTRWDQNRRVCRTCARRRVAEYRTRRASTCLEGE